MNPGADGSEFKEHKEEDEDEAGNAMNVDTVQGYGLGASTTGNENNVGTEVMAWEDPFREAHVSSFSSFIRCIVALQDFFCSLKLGCH